MAVAKQPGGYMGRMLRVDLTTGKFSEEAPDGATLRKYLGGTGIGIKYLYDEVPPGTAWNDPGNRLVFATGPVGGTRIAGSGSFSIVTKGALTNGATSTQAAGFFGAFLKFSGFDG
ncbi:MAG: aldehyde ferredoxin oxidoreductase N-terminal domain-containing protein, partial [Chloroflexota bacterium]